MVEHDMYQALVPENVDVSPRGRLAIEAALSGGKAVMEEIDSMEVTTKEGINNFVTNCDLASQEAIISLIKNEYPNDQILSEETDTEIDDVNRIENLWVIDPIDGTNNLIYRRNRSCISVAFARNGEVLVGAVYDPFNKELYFAENGKGAFLNGRRLTIHNQSNLTEAVVSTDPAYDSQTIRQHLELLLRIPETPPRILLRGSSVLSICEIASERTHLFFHVKLQPWDTAAATLIVRESGGVVLDFDGNPATLSSKSIIASNEKLSEKFLGIVKKTI